MFLLQGRGGEPVGCKVTLVMGSGSGGWVLFLELTKMTQALRLLSAWGGDVCCFHTSCISN